MTSVLYYILYYASSIITESGLFVFTPVERFSSQSDMPPLLRLYFHTMLSYDNCRHNFPLLTTSVGSGPFKLRRLTNMVGQHPLIFPHQHPLKGAFLSRSTKKFWSDRSPWQFPGCHHLVVFCDTFFTQKPLHEYFNNIF